MMKSVLLTLLLMAVCSCAPQRVFSEAEVPEVIRG